jgi:hypothetical protein
MSPEISQAFAHLLDAISNTITYLGPAIAGAIGYHYATGNGAKIAFTAQGKTDAKSTA